MIAKGTNRSGVSSPGEMHSVDGNSESCEPPEEPPWLKPNFVRCMTVLWSNASMPKIKTKGGIIIPDTAREKPSQGEVIAVGPGGRDEAGKLVPIDINVGDKVLFGKWSGTEIKLDGEELLIMKESDIMGVVG